MILNTKGDIDISFLIMLVMLIDDRNRWTDRF
jgi:hypothetical protein